MLRFAPVGIVTCCLALFGAAPAAAKDKPHIELDGEHTSSYAYAWRRGRLSGAATVSLKVGEGKLLLSASEPGAALLFRLAQGDMGSFLKTIGADEHQHRPPHLVVPCDPNDWFAVLARYGDRAQGPSIALDFRIEVLPDETLRANAEHHGRKPARLGLWTGDTQSFENFKREEVERWHAAAKNGDPYVPAKPGLRLVQRQGTDGTTTEHFRVVEDGTGWHPGIDMVGLAEISRNELGQPTVVLTVRGAFQEKFRDYTERSVGLPLAILIDGEHYSSPWIHAPLDAHVQITTGSAPDDALVLARRLVGAVRRAQYDGPASALEGGLRIDAQGTLDVLLPAGRDEPMALRANNGIYSSSVDLKVAHAEGTSVGGHAILDWVVSDAMGEHVPAPATSSADLRVVLSTLQRPEDFQRLLSALANAPSLSQAQWQESLATVAQSKRPAIQRIVFDAAAKRKPDASFLPTLRKLVASDPELANLADAVALASADDVRALSQSPAPVLRELAARSLRNTPVSDDGAGALLLVLAKDDNDSVALAALDSAGYALLDGHEVAVERLMDALVAAQARDLFSGGASMALSNRLDDVVAYADRALPNDPQRAGLVAKSVLTVLMYREDVSVKFSASAAAALEQALHDEAHAIEVATLLRLVQRGHPPALDALLGTLEGPEQRAFVAAMAIYHTIEDNSVPEGPVARAKAMEAFRKLATRPEQHLKDAAAVSLFALGDRNEDVRTHVQKVATEGRSGLSHLAQNLLKETPR